MTKLVGNPLNSDEAAKCADIMAMVEDLSQAHDAANIYLSGKYAGDGENMRTRRALYESALISFRRAFINGSSRLPGKGRGRWSIPEHDMNKILGVDKAAYTEILNLADKCVAHRVRTEAGHAQVVSDAPIGKPNVQLKYTERVMVFPALISIASRLRTYLIPLISKYHESAVSCSQQTINGK